VKVDRKALLAALGPDAAFEAMSHEERAEALESYMMAQLGGLSERARAAPVRRGTGVIFGGPTPSGVQPDLGPLPALPEKPALVDFFRLRFIPHTVAHMLQSASHACKSGEPEETVFACLPRHRREPDQVDHGYWARR
jgi:hypothetical protein